MAGETKRVFYLIGVLILSLTFNYSEGRRLHLDKVNEIINYLRKERAGILQNHGEIDPEDILSQLGVEKEELFQILKREMPYFVSGGVKRGFGKDISLPMDIFPWAKI
jgi:hypothetical protein